MSHHSTLPQDETSEPAPAPVESIGRQTARGAMWLAGAGMGVQGLSFISSIIVARYLMPTDYGTVAMAMVVVALAGIFVTFGFSPAIVSGRMQDPKAIISSHWLICMAGFFLAILTFAIGRPAASHFFNNPKVVRVLAAASCMLAINAWRVVPQALLYADGKFNVVAIISVITQFFATSTGIIMAVKGFGEWALIAPSLVTAVIGTSATIYWSRLKIRPDFHWTSVKPYLTEGSHIVGNAITNYIFDSSDQIVVGHELGTIPLGNYNFAFGLVSKSLDVFSRTISTPLLASLGPLRHHLQRLDRAVVRACLAIGRITLPISAGGIILAPLILSALAGPRWKPDATLVRIFFVLGALQSIGQISGPVWLAMGRTRLVLFWGLISNTSVLGAFLVGAWFGKAETVAASYTIYSALVLSPLCIWATRRWCELPLKGLGTGFLRILRDVAIMCVAVYLVGLALDGVKMKGIILLFLQIGVGGLVYLACFRFASTAEMQTVLSAMPRKIQAIANRVLAMPSA